MGLPGVSVGPLDPEATREFGTVSAQNSARELIRLHRQMYPQSLLQALAKPRDDARTQALDPEEVHEYLSGLSHPNGDPMLPEGARVVGHSVRGDPLSGRQLLAFTYEVPSGRHGKWYAPYGADELPGSFEKGSELSRIKEMKDRGVVSYDTEGTRAEIAERQLAQTRRENRRLREDAERAGTAAASSVGGDETESNLRAENQELRDRLSRLEQLVNARAGGVPTEGLADDIPDREAQSQPAGEGSVAEDPPYEGYEDQKADDVVRRLRDPGTSAEERNAILSYEQSHANRKSVVAAAQGSLGSRPE